MDSNNWLASTVFKEPNRFSPQRKEFKKNLFYSHRWTQITRAKICFQPLTLSSKLGALWIG